VNHEYLVNYTNAAFMVKEGFKLPEDGLYSGYDADKHTYDKSTWNYEEGGDLDGRGSRRESGSSATPRLHNRRRSSRSKHPLAWKCRRQRCPSMPPKVPTTFLATSAMRVSTPEETLLALHAGAGGAHHGIPKDQIVKAADLFTSVRKDGDMKKVGTIIYAVGWTQHSSGTQTIRAAAHAATAAGKCGRAGGGLNALRGHSNIQGATDMAGISTCCPAT
jgi:formate dehydrogenase major subunit